MISLRCPSCTRGVRLRSRDTGFAVCPACRAALLRHGSDLTAIGPAVAPAPESGILQLGVEGYDGALPFVVIGRLTREWQDGRWNEWYVLRDDGECAWLADAAGELALMREMDVAHVGKFDFGAAQVGTALRLAGSSYVVTDIKEAILSGIDGELPRRFREGHASLCLDLEGPRGGCATLEQDADGARRLHVGEYRNAMTLRLSNLRTLPGW